MEIFLSFDPCEGREEPESGVPHLINVADRWCVATWCGGGGGDGVVDDCRDRYSG